MNEVWVLTVETSLADTRRTVNVFTNFEKAREAFRMTVKKYAFTKNSMFDGNGNIVYFQEYIDNIETVWFDEVVDEDVDEDEQGDNIFGGYYIDMLEKKHFEFIAEALRKTFSGNDIDFELPYDECDDDMIGVSYSGDTLLIYGTGDGPINGYTPEIETNIFSMIEEKEYYLYIDDMFGQDESNKLYIHLTKAEVQ